MIKLQEVLNARRLALDILIKCDKDSAYINLEFKNNIAVLRDRRDRALCREIVYSVIENRVYIDYIISKLSSVKIKKLSLQVKNILREGIAQIKFMDKIPNNAVVNECVKLAKIYSFKSSGFINAVLRNYLRKKEMLESEIEKMNETDKLLLINSVPAEIYNIFKNSYGSDTANQLISVINNKNRNFIHINTLKITSGEFYEKVQDNNVIDVISKVPEYDDILEVKIKDAVEKDGMHQRGLYHFESVPSVLTCKLLNALPGEIIFDLCAAPGGKSFTIAEEMDNSGEIYSFDIHEHKINIIRKNAMRLGINIIKSGINDASVLNEKLINKADKVLCDVPCSGLGVIFKKPDIKYKSIDKINALPDLQLKILNNAAKYCKKSGSIVYSTCTLNINENEEVVRKFLKVNPDFIIDTQSKIEYDGKIITDDAGYNTFMPHETGLEGFFCVKLKRI